MKILFLVSLLHILGFQVQVSYSSLTIMTSNVARLTVDDCRPNDPALCFQVAAEYQFRYVYVTNGSPTQYTCWLFQNDPAVSLGQRYYQDCGVSCGKGETILFRFNAGTNVHPYSFWSSAPVNVSHDAQYTSPIFKSPLMWLWPIFINPGEVDVKLYEKGHKVAQLSFSSIGVSTLSNPQDAFFSQSMLVQTDPWSLAVAQSYSYSYFQAAIQSKFNLNRSFSMVQYGGCPKDFAIMAVYETLDPCSYTAGAKYPLIIYSYNFLTGGWNNLNANYRAADEMRITIPVDNDNALYRAG